MTGPADDLPHRPPAGAGPEWSESWCFELAAPDASFGAFVRLAVHPARGTAAFWAYAVGDACPLVVARHDRAALPRGRVLEVREDALWAALHCEDPLVHWSVQLEAFAVILDPEDPAARAPGEERGERVPFGLDLEWEACGEPAAGGAPAEYAQPCIASGEVLVGPESIDVGLAAGHRRRRWGSAPDWPPECARAAGQLGGWRFDSESAPGGVDRTTLWRPPDAAGRVADVDLRSVPRHEVTIALGSGHRPAALTRALCVFEADDEAGAGWTERT